MFQNTLFYPIVFLDATGDKHLYLTRRTCSIRQHSVWMCWIFGCSWEKHGKWGLSGWFQVPLSSPSTSSDL